MLPLLQKFFSSPLERTCFLCFLFCFCFVLFISVQPPNSMVQVVPCYAGWMKRLTHVLSSGIMKHNSIGNHFKLVFKVILGL